MPMRKVMRLLSKGMRPLSNLARRTAVAAIERAALDARTMPGNLLPHERLDDMTAAARRIVAEVERLPEAPYDVFTNVHKPIDDTVVGLLVGRSLGLHGDELLQLGLGMFLKDVGELALPPAIVEKAAPLDEAESELMRRHPQRGIELVRDMHIGREARAVIAFHHERWDGLGYPLGLSGEGIPLSARIAAVAEGFVTAPDLDAMRAGAGHAVDPELVDVLADVAMARSPGLGLVA
jgi:response regulator RpfG family c-di-GMP phosphodiesterase